MIPSDHLNLHFRCFIYVWRIVPSVAHNVFFFFHAKALVLMTVVSYQRWWFALPNHFDCKAGTLCPKEHAHLSGLKRIPTSWKTAWFNRKVGLPRKHAIKNEHLTALWLEIVDLTQAYGKFMQQGYCIKTISVERQNGILSLPSSPPLLSRDSVFMLFAS